MEVILLEDVPNVGKKYEEKTVADGYGTNYLIPRGLARVANETSRAELAEQKKRAEKRRAEKREKRAEQISELSDVSVEIEVRANEQGRLFASLKPENLAEAISEQTGVEITADEIEKQDPIDRVGEYQIKVSLLESEVTVDVRVSAE